MGAPLGGAAPRIPDDESNVNVYFVDVLVEGVDGLPAHNFILLTWKEGGTARFSMIMSYVGQYAIKEWLSPERDWWRSKPMSEFPALLQREGSYSGQIIGNLYQD